MAQSGLLLFIAYLGFISLGLPDPLIGVAWPSVREEFRLRQSDVSLIFFGSGCSYFLSSFFAGRLLKFFNVGVLLALSSGLVALSGFDYGMARSWQLFACGALLHGLGSGAIDAGLNHYVANHFSAKHMNWLHACYSLGAMIGPFIMTLAIAQANNWRAGYLIVASTLLTLSVLFVLTRKSWDEPTKDVSAENGSSQPKGVSAGQALKNGTVLLHIIIFFIYTGVEVAIGQWSYTVLTESRGISKDVAGYWTTIYWASIFVGRVAFGFVLDRVGIDNIIRLSTVLATIGALLFAWNPMPMASPIALCFAGVGLACIFPCLMTRTPQRLGKEVATHAIGFQVGAAMLGAAALPSICGVLAQYRGLGYVPIALLIMAVVLLALHEFLIFSDKQRAI